MQPRDQLASVSLGLGAVLCAAQAVPAICFETRNKNCCDYTTVDKDRTCSEAPCPDVYLQNNPYQHAAQVATGLSGYSTLLTMQDCCRVQRYVCVVGSCNADEISSASVTPTIANGTSCQTSGGGGGNTEPSHPGAPLPP